jgi:hypothetical protein
MSPGPEDEVSQAEKARVMLQDADVRRQQQAQGTTMHARAVADASIETGRFTAVNAAYVVGSTPVLKYPAAAAHQRDPVGTEPPLGYSVDQVEPIGPSAASLLPAEQTDAPAGATPAAGNLPPASADSGDAGASLSRIRTK